MPKRKKRKITGKAIRKSQVSSIYTPTIRLRSKQLSDLDNHLLKRTFLLFDDESPWERTSNCKIFNSGAGFHIRLLFRERIHDKKGKRKISEKIHDNY